MIIIRNIMYNFYECNLLVAVAIKNGIADR